MLPKTFFKSLNSFQYSFSLILASCILLSSWSLSGQPGHGSTNKWVGTWSTAPQLVEPGNMPPSPGLTNNSLRQVVRVSIGGDTLRVKFSNEFSNSPVTMKSVQIAVSTGGNTIDGTTNKELKFNGNPEITMNAGATVTSDPISFNLTPRMDLAITIYYGQTSAATTGHPGSRTTSYLLAGNTTTTTDFTGAVPTDHWYTINAIDVLASTTTASVAILGNSITDGRGSTTNMQNRWPDVFSESLLKNATTQQVGVLNMGIGGNCVLAGGLGPTAVSRYERDILNQSGVRWAVVFIGVNDIGGVRTADAATKKTIDLISAFKEMIIKAHAKNIRIYGTTILPFNGNGYYNQYSELCRNNVNQWIRAKGNFDRYIDVDKAMRSPLDSTKLVSTYQNDGLHPDAAGYKTMGEYIDVNLFTGSDTIFLQEANTETESLWVEAERFVTKTAGTNFNIVTDALASNGKYITVEAGVQSLAAAPSDSTGLITIPFIISKDTTYNVFARLKNPTADDDSFWVKLDSGAFTMCNGLTTSGGFTWLKLVSSVLAKGKHTLTIGYREDGACLDKICISSYAFAPTGMGEADLLAVGNHSMDAMDGYLLGQNYPNPFNKTTNISFEIPDDTFVSLKVHNMLGTEMEELAGKELLSGKHTVKFDAKDLPKGIYFCKMKTDNYLSSLKMILQGE